MKNRTLMAYLASKAPAQPDPETLAAWEETALAQFLPPADELYAAHALIKASKAAINASLAHAGHFPIPALPYDTPLPQTARVGAVADAMRLCREAFRVRRNKDVLLAELRKEFISIAWPVIWARKVIAQMEAQQ